MLIRLLKAIIELIVVSLKLTYVYLFYPISTPSLKAKKIIDPQYDEHIYGSGENAEALKDKWIHDNMSDVEESRWRQEKAVDLLDTEIYD